MEENINTKKGQHTVEVNQSQKVDNERENISNISNENNTKIILRVDTSTQESGNMEMQSIDKNVEKGTRTETKGSKDNETEYACDFCCSAVKTLVDCDLCGKWACKACMGVSAVWKMRQIGPISRSQRPSMVA